MTIILNENLWAEQMIEKCSLGKKPFETMTRVARYYIDKGYTKSKVRSLLDEFLLRCDSSASLPKWADMINAAHTLATKRKAVVIDYIPITDTELEKISMLIGRQTKRLAFTLLCLSKYWNAINSNSNSWINNKYSDIMHMANINTSIKRQCHLFHILFSSGMIRFPNRVDSTSLQINIVEDGNEVLRITDFRNLGYQYLRYLGEPYIECQNCGALTKGTVGRGRPKKYCPQCAAEIAAAQRIQSVKRSRNCIC